MLQRVDAYATRDAEPFYRSQSTLIFEHAIPANVSIEPRIIHVHHVHVLIQETLLPSHADLPTVRSEAIIWLAQSMRVPLHVPDVDGLIG